MSQITVKIQLPFE